MQKFNNQVRNQPQMVSLIAQLIIPVLQQVAEEEELEKLDQIKGKPKETIKNLRGEEQRVLENKIKSSNQGIKEKFRV